MHILIIKTSSMGDIIHTLPALTDAGNAMPGIRFDWIIEESFAEIPRWHPLVDRVISINMRKWRKQPGLMLQQGWGLYRQLRARRYDYVIDAQGLLKSALLGWLSSGVHCGYDRRSARESWASLFYRRRYTADWEMHAVTRIRTLFASSLNYSLPLSPPEYGIARDRLPTYPMMGKYLVFIHGTTWSSKQWPEAYWCELAKLANQVDYRVQLPWGNQEEYERAQRIAAACADNVEVLPSLNLTEMAFVLANARGAVAVDTGLGHLSAALSVPTISLYGPTDPKCVGTLGLHQLHLSMDFSCAPCERPSCSYSGNSSVKPACFGTMSPSVIWEKLQNIL